MSKYGEIACSTVKKTKEGMTPERAWGEAAKDVFPGKRPSRTKSCPRNAFLGLAEEGLVVGVAPGQYTNSKDNKRYAIKGVDLLRENPNLARQKSVLWRRVMHAEGNEGKSHNNQMDAVIGLWSNGDIRSDSQPKPTTQRAAQSANVANAARCETIHRIEDSFPILQR